ncbi:MAG: hypothetical protein ACKVQS_05545 [Fimbriimonadaceae bacterium]
MNREKMSNLCEISCFVGLNFILQLLVSSIVDKLSGVQSNFNTQSLLLLFFRSAIFGTVFLSAIKWTGQTNIWIIATFTFIFKVLLFSAYSAMFLRIYGLDVELQFSFFVVSCRVALIFTFSYVVVHVGYQLYDNKRKNSGIGDVGTGRRRDI